MIQYTITDYNDLFAIHMTSHEYNMLKKYYKDSVYYSFIKDNKFYICDIDTNDCIYECEIYLGNPNDYILKKFKINMNYLENKDIISEREDLPFRKFVLLSIGK